VEIARKPLPGLGEKGLTTRVIRSNIILEN